MTESEIKELLLKHDRSIEMLATSIEHLVKSQEQTSNDLKETNKRLEEISKLLSKQVVFSEKLNVVEKDARECCKRAHKRIDEIEETQRSDQGCSSVKLVNRDVVALTKEVTRLIGTVEEHRIKIDQVDKLQTKSISPKTLMWAAGLTVGYLITFGTYVVQTFNKLERTDAKITTLLERDIRDTAKLMERIK